MTHTPAQDEIMTTTEVWVGDEYFVCHREGRHVEESAEYHSEVDCPFAYPAADQS